MDIRVSRDLPVKQIIHNLFSAIGASTNGLQGCYAKAMKSKKLLFPSDNLRDKEIFDGEVLRIL